MMNLRRVGLLVALVSLPLAACRDDGPQGPGSWNVRVRSSGPPPGAAMVELSGVFMESVDGVGSSSAFGAPLEGRLGPPATWGVVVVSAGAGEMTFTVRVTDLAEGPPRAVVTAAVDAQDQPVDISSFSVDLSRSR
jgi:hypothetical protein